MNGISQNSTILYCPISHARTHKVAVVHDLLCPPTKCEEGHISFSADPGRQRRRDSLVSTIFLESMGGILPDLHGYIIGTSQAKEWSKFW